MCELTIAEIDDVSGGRSIFYEIGYFFGRMAANLDTVDMSGALAQGA